MARLRAVNPRIRPAVLGDAAEPLTVPDIFGVVVEEFELGQVNAAVLRLHDRLEADRFGVRGQFRYALTLKGFAVLRGEIASAPVKPEGGGG